MRKILKEVLISTCMADYKITFYEGSSKNSFKVNIMKNIRNKCIFELLELSKFTG